MRSATGSRRLVAALLGAVLVGSCGTAPSPAPASPAASPPPVTTPGPTGAACARAGIQLVNAFIERLAAELVPLRSLALSSDLNAVAAATAMRRMSAVLTAFDELGGTLSGCDTTAGLGAGVATLREQLDAVLVPVMKGSIKDAALQRRGAVQMLQLLPQLVGFADAATDVARAQGLANLVPAVDPLESLRPLVASLAAPAPAGTAWADFSAFSRDLWPVIDPLSTAMRKAASANKRTRRAAAGSLLGAATTAKAWLATHEPVPCYASYWTAVGDAIGAYESAATAYAESRLTAGADALKDARSLEAGAKRMSADAAVARCQLEPATQR